MTDNPIAAIAEGVKLEDAIVILREGLRSDRPLTLKERLLIGKIIDERAALTAAGEMAGERAKALEEAAQCVEKMQTNNVGMVHPIAAAEAAAIRALKTVKSPPPLSE